MKKSVYILILCFLCFGIFSMTRHFANQWEARQRLDHVLGKNKITQQSQKPFFHFDFSSDRVSSDVFADKGFGDDFLDDMLSQMPSQPSPGQNRGLFGHFGFQSLKQPQVSNLETETAYVFKIPVNSEEEAQNIKIKVSHKRINISGKLSMRSSDGKNVVGSSSFVRSISLNRTVKPNEVQRQLIDSVLVITVPKLHPSAVPDNKLNHPGQNGKVRDKRPSTLKDKLKGVPQEFI